jgi:hypothetical protein
LTFPPGTPCIVATTLEKEKKLMKKVDLTHVIKKTGNEDSDFIQKLVSQKLHIILRAMDTMHIGKSTNFIGKFW